MVAFSTDGFCLRSFPDACSLMPFSLKPPALPLPCLPKAPDWRAVDMLNNLMSVLEGEIVRLEPLAWRHERGLFGAAQDGRVWRWMHYDPSGSPEMFHAWLEHALAATEAGTEGAFATVDAGTGKPV